MAQDSLLKQIHSPQDVKALSLEQLETLCEELREVLIETVAHTGGHLSSNLGVVELTVAMHKVFDLPTDQIVWDVGHQCYVHKLLTGRLDRFGTLRQQNGISGFPRPSESEYDTFIVGHSSTSISAANGMAKAKTLRGEPGCVVAVIGDGALTGGLAYEGLSNAGRSTDRLIVVLNDNHMSISKNVGYVARHLANLRSRANYVRAKTRFSNALLRIPLIGRPLHRFFLQAKLSLKRALYNQSTMFEEMGFYYLGPVNGHNLNDLCRALQTARKIDRPVLLHVETVKGKGYPFAVQSPDTYHGVSGFHVLTGQTPPASRSFSTVFGETMVALARDDERLCAITAAMKSGTCLTNFAAAYPRRFFDVGIAEEHAVTFASGLACNGIIPVFAVYSTFLQRAYDQLLNDTAIIGNHIVLAIDRAGIVPDDGETHQGIFDVPFLCTIPGVTVFSPATYSELELQLRQAVYDTPRIAAVRYPKGAELPLPAAYEPDGKPFTLLEQPQAGVLLVTYGRIFANVWTAARRLTQAGTPVSVLKLNRICPLDEGSIAAAREYTRVLFFEEGERTGGVGEHFGARLLDAHFAGQYTLHAIDGFLSTCTTEEGLRQAGFDVDGILRAVGGCEAI